MKSPSNLITSLVVLLFSLIVSTPCETTAQIVVRGKFVTPRAKLSDHLFVKSVDLVSNSVIDSVGASEDGSFMLPIRQAGIHRVYFSIGDHYEILARLYIELSFDLEVELSGDSSATLQLKFLNPESHTAKLYRIYEQLGAECAKYSRATRKHPLKPGQGDKSVFDWDPYVAELNRQIVTETDPLIRQALLIARLGPAVFGDTLSPAAARFALNSISARHPFWEEATILCNSSVRANFLAYLDSVVQTHPDPYVRGLAMFFYLPQGRVMHDSVRVRQYAARLLSEFPASSLSKMAAPFANISMYDVSVGTHMPSFSFADLNQSSTQISGNQFRGKVYLIAFWATWCIHCVEQMPFLRTAYNRYNRSGLQILSVSLDDTPRAAASFLQARPALP